jgi:hypothetical protein
MEVEVSLVGDGSYSWVGFKERFHLRANGGKGTRNLC